MHQISSAPTISGNALPPGCGCFLPVSTRFCQGDSWLVDHLREPLDEPVQIKCKNVTTPANELAGI